MNTLPKSLAKLKSDNRVSKLWSEQDSEDGYWLMLNTGFADMGFDPHYPHHTIHEDSVKRMLQRMKDVRPCACKECKP